MPVEMERFAELDRDRRALEEPVVPVVRGGSAGKHHGQHRHVGETRDTGRAFFELAIAVQCRSVADADAAFRENDDTFARLQATYGVADGAGGALFAVNGQAAHAA